MVQYNDCISRKALALALFHTASPFFSDAE